MYFALAVALFIGLLFLIWKRQAVLVHSIIAKIGFCIFSFGLIGIIFIPFFSDRFSGFEGIGWVFISGLAMLVGVVVIGIRALFPSSNEGQAQAVSVPDVLPAAQKSRFPQYLIGIGIVIFGATVAFRDLGNIRFDAAVFATGLMIIGATGYVLQKIRQTKPILWLVGVIITVIALVLYLISDHTPGYQPPSYLLSQILGALGVVILVAGVIKLRRDQKTQVESPSVLDQQ